MRKHRFLLALMVLLGAGALAGTTDSNTLTVNIPPFLSLKLDATDYLFDFASGVSGSINVGVTSYPKASQGAYELFMDTATGFQAFAPTSVTGGGDGFGTVVVRTNQGQWTVSISNISGTLPPPLDNSRVLVLAEKDYGKGISWATAPTTLGTITLIKADSAGAGKSVYKLYYFLNLHINDEIPTLGYSSSITVDLSLTSP